jgi:PBSX family phage terminase large subunit
MFWQALFTPSGEIDLSTPFNEFAFWGGYGAGKTMVVLLALYNLCQMYPRLRCTLIRETYTQLDDTVIADFNDMFEGNGYRHMQQQKEMRFQNGALLRFRAFDMPEKILGGSIDVIALSQAEQIPKKLFKEIFGRQRGSSTLKRKILITEGNPAECWAKERYIDNPIPENIFFLNASTYDNREYLDRESPDFIKNMEQNFTEDEIASRIRGEWNTHSLMVFSSFKADMNIVDPFQVEPGMKIILGGDYGYRNPSALVWILKDFDGNLIVFDEWYMAEQSVDQIAAEMKRHGKLPVIYDYSTKRPDRDGKSVWSDLEKEGIPLIECNKDELRNISHTNKLFKTCRLFITKNCTNLIKEVKNYHWKKLSIRSDLNMPESTQDKDNHAIDALLYAVAFIEDLYSKDPKKDTPGIRLIQKLTSKDPANYMDKG